ncbi:primosomal protein N' [Candidatus Acidulodesulfobacterium sp. H_13]|uniref:replication restart helicase PriA n=1 Tax=Candidatus Acidulodesulfobacterium sp. H_13 TaxID=3395470 RepID=UPI003AF464FF
MIADIVIPKSGTNIKFIYLIPEEFETEAEVGRAVIVPLKNRPVYGFIFDIKQDEPCSFKNKKISLKKIRRISKAVFFKEAHKDMYNFLMSYYHENISRVFETVLPSIDVNHFDLIDKYYNEALAQKAGDACIPNSAFLSEAPYDLTVDQTDSVNIIKESIKNCFYKTFLIHGVTASGKTEIYFNLLDFALSLNKQIIIIVPEIFITNQFIYLIKKRFKGLAEQNSFAIFHSKISKKEKFVNWIKILNGDIKLILGARSAIFAPVKNSGLVIVDEEHDGSYKQQSGLLYNARDVAVMLSKKTSGVCVLGSATPSLESYYNATELKKYEYIYIKSRVKGKSLPETDIIDLKTEFKNSGKRRFSDKILSNETTRLIEENIGGNRQVLLFLNRRGFSTFLICSSCGHLFLCNNCAISLVYHKNKNADAGGFLKCHYCGHSEDIPKLCPECGMDTIEPYGIGVQKLEDVVKTLFAVREDVKIERIDSDIAKSGKNGADIFKKMQKKEIDILIGTQIITKGHDFPDVGLVVVILADSLLNIPDFRSSEKAFQVLTQVSGRAGRGEGRGRIAIQTFIGNNYLLRYVATHDTKGFYEKELAIRKEYGYPPYTKIVALKLTDKNVDRLKVMASDLKEVVDFNIKSPDFTNISILGPSPCPIEKIKNDFRYQLILKGYPQVSNLHKLINILRGNERLSGYFSSQKIVIDVDPDILM